MSGRGGGERVRTRDHLANARTLLVGLDERQGHPYTLARGDHVPFETRAGLAFAVLELLLGIGTIVLIIADLASRSDT